MYNLEKEKRELCQEIGNFFGCYFEENGKLCVDNGDAVFRYNTADELLSDWVETLVESCDGNTDANNWEKEILFIFKYCMGKHPAGLRKLDHKNGPVWQVSVSVQNPNHPHGKSIYIGTYGSVVDAMLARRAFLSEDIADVDTNTEEGLTLALEKAKERRIQAKEKLKVLAVGPQFAVIFTHPDKDVAVYLFNDIKKAKAFLRDNFELTIKNYRESNSDISEFINGDETYARITYIPDDLDCDNETTEIRIGSIYQ